MPGDLSDQRFLFPFHYEPLYEPGRNPFEGGLQNLEGYLQGIVKSVRGYGMAKDELQNLKDHLDKKGMLNRNPGDEAFRNEVIAYLRMLKSAKKVAARCLS